MDASTLRIVCAGLVVVFGAAYFFSGAVAPKRNSRNGWEGRGDSTVPRPFFISGLTHFTVVATYCSELHPPAPLRLVVWRGRDPLESGLAPPLLPRSRRKRWRDRAPRLRP